MTQFILIDSRNMCFRHNSVNLHLSRSTDGFPTGAIYGSLNGMLTLHKRLPDAAIVWVWDGKGETWRHKFMNEMPKLDLTEAAEDEVENPFGFSNDLEQMGRTFLESSISNWTGLGPAKVKHTPKPRKYGYKANRARPELEKKKEKSAYPEDPRERALLQIPVLRLILEGCGIRNYEVEGLEGDDLLAMLVKKIKRLDHDAEVFIHSGDKDYYQLLSWKNVKVLASIDSKLTKINAEYVLNNYGVKVNDWAKYDALTGGHNNVGHLKGIGKVTALKMLEEGIDPSQSELPHKLKLFPKIIPDGIPPAKIWSYIHNNYKLCKLVYEPDDELLSTEVRSKLVPMFSHMDSTKRFYRSSKGKDAEAYRKITFLLQRYEMASIIARRDLLWDIP